MDTEEIVTSVKDRPVFDIEVDLGNLLASNPNDIDKNAFRQDRDTSCQNVATEAVQLIVNKLWALPIKRVDDAVCVELPAPTYVLPREKPVPKERKPTKWETYAKAKGITKKKKDKQVWDDVVKKWVPQYGFKRAEVEKIKTWAMPASGDGADPYEKAATAKSERVAKNELQRLKNIARQRKVKLPSVGIPSGELPDTSKLGRAVQAAKLATASLGKFEEKLPKEKPDNSRKRVRFEPLVGDPAAERDANMKVLDGILAKRPKIDIEKAVNKEINMEQVQRSNEKKGKKKKGGGGGGRKHGFVKKGGGGGFGGKGGKGGKGKKGAKTFGGKKGGKGSGGQRQSKGNKSRGRK